MGTQTSATDQQIVSTVYRLADLVHYRWMAAFINRNMQQINRLSIMWLSLAPVTYILYTYMMWTTILSFTIEETFIESHQLYNNEKCAYVCMGVLLCLSFQKTLRVWLFAFHLSGTLKRETLPISGSSHRAGHTERRVWRSLRDWQPIYLHLSRPLWSLPGANTAERQARSRTQPWNQEVKRCE